jgi:hypothetical protein
MCPRLSTPAYVHARDLLVRFAAVRIGFRAGLPSVGLVRAPTYAVFNPSAAIPIF